VVGVIVRSQQTLENAATIAELAETRVADLSTRARPESKTLLAGILPNEIQIDGYADDWSTFEMEARQYRYSMNKVSIDPVDRELAASFSVHAAVRRGYLYLFIRVIDQQIQYHNAISNQMATGDQVVIRVPDENSAIRRYTFRWEAPGSDFGRYFGDAIEGVRPIRLANDYSAALTESGEGYHVELRMPLPAGGRFGLSVIDADATDDVLRWTGMFDPGEPDDVGQLHTVDNELNETLTPFTEPGMRLRIFNGQGWLLADSDQRLPDASVRQFNPSDHNLFDAVLYRFIAWSLAKNVDTRTMPEIDNGKLGIREFEPFYSATKSLSDCIY